jgi:argininosuccinate lyase
MPFREAHHITGRLVRLADELACTLDRLPLSEMQKIAPGANKDVYDVMGIQNSVQSRRSLGGTAPDRVLAQIGGWRSRLQDQI